MGYSPKWLFLYLFNFDNIDLTSVLYLSFATPVATSQRLQEFLKKHNIQPVLIFENLTEPATKKVAYRSLKPFSGIYLIVNLENGKYSVGSAVMGNLYMRFHSHLFAFTGNVRVANAVKKYGLSEFAFIVLEIVPQEGESPGTQNSTALLNREDHYIKTLCPEYNIAPLASNTAGWNHTEETKQKMRENYSEERRQQVAEINKGKTLSDETKALIREAALNRKPMSLETRLKCVTNVRPVTITDLDGTNPQFFPTITLAAEAIGCDVKTIRRALQSTGIIKRKYLVTDTLDT